LSQFSFRIFLHIRNLFLRFLPNRTSISKIIHHLLTENDYDMTNFEFCRFYDHPVENLLNKSTTTTIDLLGMMSCNDQFQEMYAGLLGDPMTNGPQLPTRILASLSAGFTAALFSMPFDLIKSRLMAQRPDPLTGEMPYKGVMDCVMKIIRAEGPMGFYNGFSAYYGRCAPHAMIVLLSKDSITKAYRNAFD
jgi:hypothetical protein